MHTLHLTSCADNEGFLHLTVPVALPNTKNNVTMTFQPVSPTFDKKKSEELGWGPGFFEETFGVWEGELERESQGEGGTTEAIAMMNDFLSNTNVLNPQTPRKFLNLMALRRKP